MSDTAPEPLDPLDTRDPIAPAAPVEALTVTDGVVVAPARRTPQRRTLTREARTAATAALVQLESTLGGRDRLVDALVLGTTADGVDTDRADYVLGLLADPKFAKKSLRTLARMAGITLQELLSLYRKASVQRAHLESLAHVAKTLPAVAQHIMERSVPYELDCHTCGGVGTLTPNPTAKVPNPSPGPCGTCQGHGRLRHEPDLERQKLALSLGGLLKGGGTGVTIINQQQQGQGAVPLATGDTLLQMQRLTDQALYGAAPEED